MYEKRIKIFVIFSLLLLVVCVLRLAQMQLLTASSVQNEIAEMKRLEGRSEQFKTIRGRILDRNGNVLATDQPRFWVHIDYQLSSFLDSRVRDAMLLRASGRADSEAETAKVAEKIRDKDEALRQIIDKCVRFRAVESRMIEQEIQSINDRVWDLRVFHAWRRRFPNSEVLNDYDSIFSVPPSRAKAEFEEKVPDPNERLKLISKVNIIEMHGSSPLLELRTDDDIFAAQFEFMDTEGIDFQSKEQRVYPYDSVAAQTIGWIGPARQERQKEFFATDRLASYQTGDMCGRRPGVEYVCEAILRGRRGEEATDIDGQITSKTETQFGKDVSLTLDIELQAYIEDCLVRYPHDPNLGEPNISAVVIDVGSSDILALVSLPVCDLNRVRYDYDTLIKDPDKPLTNRAINEQYPPGSVVKPLILVAGLEAGAITPEQVIECPHEPAPPGWPDCLIFRKGGAHTWMWENHARNAIKGSCNIYFSRLADSIDPLVLQQWLFQFGYGQHTLSMPYSIAETAGAELRRNFRQAPGEISSRRVWGKALPFEEMPPLVAGHRKMFGIGQGDLRVTPLQVANAMATIARRGLFRLPRLFITDSHSSAGVDLSISPETVAIIHDGMRAVVRERGGTAFVAFEPSLPTLDAKGVTVYGKTGSTERPYHAWFAGFAADGKGRKIAVAVVVEGGQSGSGDAAPLAREIIRLCVEAEYVGKSTLTAK